MKKIIVVGVLGVMLGVLVSLLIKRAWPRSADLEDSEVLVAAGEFQ